MLRKTVKMLTMLFQPAGHVCITLSECRRLVTAVPEYPDSSEDVRWHPYGFSSDTVQG